MYSRFKNCINYITSLFLSLLPCVQQAETGSMRKGVKAGQLHRPTCIPAMQTELQESTAPCLFYSITTNTYKLVYVHCHNNVFICFGWNKHTYYYYYYYHYAVLYIDALHGQYNWKTTLSIAVKNQRSLRIDSRWIDLTLVFIRVCSIQCLKFKISL